MKAAVDVRKMQFKIFNSQIPYKMCFRTAVFGDKVFGVPPMPLDLVGVCTGVRVHEINLVVNLEVLIAFRCEAVVCLPAVANNGRPRLYIVFDDR